MDDKERSDVNNPQNGYRERSKYVGGLRNPAVNLGSTRSLRNVHVATHHRYFSKGFRHQVRTTDARDTDL